jgi:hypothetical protein
VVGLIKALAWPVTVVWLVVWLYTPIIELMRAIGQRASKLKVFQFEVELAKLVPASANLSAMVEALQKAEVQTSGSALIIAGVTQSATADYVLVPLGAERDQAWITSRLFLLAALIDRNRVVRCIVFTGEYGTFIGAASPRDVRGEIGARFPEYERALLAAYGGVSTSDLREFRNGALSESTLITVAHLFLENPDISSLTAPTSSGWIFLDRSSRPASVSTWEFGDYVTAGLLRTMLRDKFDRGSVVGAAGTVQNEDISRAIVNQTGTFVGLISAAGEFRELCDRTIIADKVARRAADQAAST